MVIAQKHPRCATFMHEIVNFTQAMSKGCITNYSDGMPISCHSSILNAFGPAGLGSSASAAVPLLAPLLEQTW